MKIAATLAAELDLLTEALDVPGIDVADTLTHLVANAQSAISSYQGLSVALTLDDSQFEITVLNEGTVATDIRTSLLVPLSPQLLAGTQRVRAVTLILYAAAAGAFIDLAADLAWISGRALDEYRLDEHRAPTSASAHSSPLGTLSIVNQAIGVLIGRGFDPAHAERELAARAALAGVDRRAAAAVILDSLGPTDAELESW